MAIVDAKGRFKFRRQSNELKRTMKTLAATDVSDVEKNIAIDDAIERIIAAARSDPLEADRQPSSDQVRSRDD